MFPVYILYEYITFSGNINLIMIFYRFFADFYLKKICQAVLIYNKDKNKKQRKNCMKTLKDAGIGEVVTIRRINGVGALPRRMMDLGLLKGADVFIRKTAPFGEARKAVRHQSSINDPAFPPELSGADFEVSFECPVEVCQIAESVRPGNFRHRAVTVQQFHLDPVEPDLYYQFLQVASGLDGHDVAHAAFAQTQFRTENGT